MERIAFHWSPSEEIRLTRPKEFLVLTGGGSVRSVFCVIVFCLFVLPVFAAEWWEEELEQQEETIVSGEAAQASAGRTFWTKGYIEVVGEAACDMAEALNEADCYLSARRAAIVLAQEKLSEMVNGVVIDGETTLRNELLVSSTLRTKTLGLIRGAEIISEDRVTLADGSILARVWMRMPLTGEGGLTGPILEHAAQLAAERKIPVFEFSRTLPETAYTGIVIDATEIEARPAMAPKLFVLEKLEAALSVDQVDFEIASREGLVEYAGTVEQALELKERIGERPILLKAVSTHGSTRSDLIISAEEGRRLAAGDPNGELIKRCKVVLAGESFL